MATKKYLNDSGLSRFLTKLKSIIPTKTSDLTNDSGFITSAPNDRVSQYNTTANANYPLLMKYTSGNTSTATSNSYARYANGLYYNPSTGELYANSNKVVTTDDSRLSDSRTPTSHASSSTTYGVGTTSNYGHCKTINNVTTSSYTNGEALSAYQGKLLADRITALENLVTKSGKELVFTDDTGS